MPGGYIGSGVLRLAGFNWLCALWCLVPEVALTLRAHAYDGAPGSPGVTTAQAGEARNSYLNSHGLLMRPIVPACKLNIMHAYRQSWKGVDRPPLPVRK